MLSVPYPYPEDQLVPWIRKAADSMQKRERFELTMVLKETESPIGICAFCNIFWEHSSGELGYWLGKPYWGRGYMTEAVKLMLTFGFEELGLERIFGRCFSRNTASARVMTKAGLKYEGHSRLDIRKGDEYLDMLHFGLYKCNYPAR